MSAERHLPPTSDSFEQVLPLGRGLSRDERTTRLNQTLGRIRSELDALADEHGLAARWPEHAVARAELLRDEQRDAHAELDALIGRGPLEGFWQSHRDCAGLSVALGDGTPFYPNPALAYVCCDHACESVTYGPLIVRREDAEAYASTDGLSADGPPPR